MTKRVLIIGGTGVFGERLVRHLAQFDGIDIVVTSRSARKARALAERVEADGTKAKVTARALDHRRDLKRQLAEIKPWTVVDCSGPFQFANYHVAEEAIASGANVIDLADARDYLLGYKRALDAKAKSQKLVAMAGASSSPTLSSAVVAHLTQGWRRVDTIDISIVPGGRGEVGRSVVEAIMTYAGRKIPIWREGIAAELYGWIGSGFVFHPDLGHRRVAPVETADAELLGSKLSVTSRIRFSAGLESHIEQYGLEALARLRKRRLFPDPTGFVSFFVAARKFTRLTTSDRGGMIVKVSGLDGQGRLVKTQWHLLAEQDHGPCVPVLPAAAAIRKLLPGAVQSGACVADGMLLLADIEREMEPYSIATKIHTEVVADVLFPIYLGCQTFDQLPKALKSFHGLNGHPVWRGKADIVRNSGWLIALISKLFGFPKAAFGIPVTVSVERGQAGGQATETWTRNFDGTCFSSHLQCGTNGTMTEKFWPFTFTVNTLSNGKTISMPVSGWRLGPISLPGFLAPRSAAIEYEDEQGRFCFDVKLSLPILGVLAHYKGWLKPAG